MYDNITLQNYNKMFKQLSEYVVNYTTSLSKGKFHQDVNALGTGSYIKYNNDIFLITNHHVAKTLDHYHIGHLPGPTDEYHAVRHFVGKDYPYDIAIAKLTDIWQTATKLALDEKFDSSYNPVDDEFIFWIGYPGSTANRHDDITENNIRRVYFEYLYSPATPFITSICNNFDHSKIQFDPKHHFAISYPTYGRLGETIILNELPNPGGLSGSLVWDSKYIKTIRNGGDWSPDLARICGIIWADFPSLEMLSATKVESMIVILNELSENYNLKLNQKKNRNLS